MEYKVLSELEAIKYSYNKDLQSCIIISITSPNSKLPIFSKNSNIKYIHRMYFEDLEQKISNTTQLLTKEQILSLKEILDIYSKEIKEIIVHCSAGISRNSAITAGIALYLNDCDNFIWDGFNGRRFIPNKYCFNLMNSVLNLGLTEKDIDNRYTRLKKTLSTYNSCIDFFIPINQS